MSQQKIGFGSMRPRSARPLVAMLFVSSFLGMQRSSAVERLSWLQGCWEMQSSSRSVEEQWLAPRGDSMIGVSRTVRDGKLVDYELMIIRENAGELAYEAHPSGQPAAVFLSVSVGDSTVLFENKQHDFPNRIGYQKSGPDTLLAWIEGSQGGQTRRIEFPYRRAKCPGTV